jgi:hypothetical protein
MGKLFSSDENLYPSFLRYCKKSSNVKWLRFAISLPLIE